MAEMMAFVSTIFAPAAAGTAASGAIGGGFLAKALGGLVSGIGAGMMKKAEYGEQERQNVAEEQRAEERYAGAGEATRFASQDASPTTGGGIDPDYQRVDAKSNFGEQVGTPQSFEAATGEKYRNRNQGSRYRYDPTTGSIQYS